MDPEELEETDWMDATSMGRENRNISETLKIEIATLDI